MPDGRHGDSGEQQAEPDQNVVHAPSPTRQPRPNRLKALLASESPTATETAQMETRRYAANVFMNMKRHRAPRSSDLGRHKSWEQPTARRAVHRGTFTFTSKP